MPLPGFLHTSLFPILLVGAAGLAWWRAAVRNRFLVRQTKDLSEEIRHLQADMVRLEESTSRDRLTGAWNRRRFEEAVAMEMGLARRRRAPLALISLDLDHFKRINDTYGHRAGDGVLAGAAGVFRTVLRASDALVRWGGEEFLVLAPATGLDGAVNLAERLRLALEGTAFPQAEPMTLSAGVAEYLAHEPLDAWIARADGALYRAKTQGRNRVVGDHARSPRSASASTGLLELIWEDGYGSGHRLIDEQHILLFDLSNALFSAIVEGLPISVAEARLDTLLYHAERHFHDEEALLRKAGYPDLDQHRSEHARLLGAARTLQADLRTGCMDFGRLVTYLATDLVKGHLLTEDCHYFEHLNHKLGRESQA
jgi:diguanylate cyclase (GGDEF)-like protein/hemerythrin-like metal-binding protein